MSRERLVQSFDIVETQHQRVGRTFGHSWAVGDAERRGAGTGGDEQTVDMAVIAAGELDDDVAPSEVAARRMALIDASVPELTRRTISRDGINVLISSASSVSASVGAPNERPGTWRG